jgi:multiple sugar transport system substrate-binding protein
MAVNFYLTGKEGMKAWTSQGTALPTRKSVAAALGYDKILCMLPS